MKHKYRKTKESDKSRLFNKPTKTAGTLLMPRQIKKGLKYFKEVKPFYRRSI